MMDPINAGRLTESLKAIEISKKEVGDEVSLMRWLERHFQGIILLFGADPTQIFYVMDHPDEFKEILDWYVDFIVNIAKAMRDMEADIIGMGETAAYFMSPRFFKEFCFEPEKKVCSAINKLSIPVLIHCCGYVPQCIHFAKETNPSGAIQTDYNVDLVWAKNFLKDTCMIIGNLNYNKLTKASTKQVFDDCIEHIKIAAQGGGYWLAFDCEIPRELSIENMRAIMQVAKTSGKYLIKL